MSTSLVLKQKEVDVLKFSVLQLQLGFDAKQQEVNNISALVDLEKQRTDGLQMRLDKALKKVRRQKTGLIIGGTVCVVSVGFIVIDKLVLKK